MLKLLSLLNILLMIISTLALTQGQQVDWSPTKTTVRVGNELDFNVNMHCKSSDDDLGNRDIPPTTYTEWSFRANFRGTTLYTCVFQWDSVRKNVVIYDAKKDEDLCISQCWRILRTDGIYFYNQYKKSWEKRYSW
ncbi:unnamed protein product [Lathyrus sativus]|nr:unnamed protein product [Lathyrus sativus]